MLKGHLFRPATLFLARGSLCLFVFPRSAAADPSDVVTFNFSETGVCVDVSCGSSTAKVTGTFSYDFDTESIVGPWSFSTPFGTMSSISGFDNFIEGEHLPHSTDTFPGLDFLLFGNTSSVKTSTLLLQLIFRDPEDIGAIVPQTPTLPDGLFFDSELGTESADFQFQGGTVTPTPEPSSLLLLGTGLLGLGPFIRRFAQS